MFDPKPSLTQSFRRLADAQQSAMRLAESGATLALETSREVAKHNLAVATDLASAVAEESRKLVDSDRLGSFARAQGATVNELVSRWSDRQEAWLGRVGETAAQWMDALQATPSSDASETEAGTEPAKPRV